jgi:protein-tyrosine phosphatase
MGMKRAIRPKLMLNIKNTPPIIANNEYKHASEIIPGLFLTDEQVLSDPAFLKDISLVVSVVDHRINTKFLEEFNIDLFTINIKDRSDQNIKGYFYNVFNRIESVLSAGGRVVVHCHRGISRSATIMISYIMIKYRMSFEDAFEFVVSKRSCVCPNIGFIYSLEILGSCFRNPSEPPHTPITV